MFYCIEQIAETPSKNEKIELLKDFLKEPEFRNIVKMTYDPFITFGILNVKQEYTGEAEFTNVVYLMLESLAKRTLTGDSARNILHLRLNSLTQESGELLTRILKCDLRCGINAITINKAYPGLIPNMPYLRCSLLDDVKLDTFDWIGGVYSQLKANGSFVNVNVFEDEHEGTEIELRTRQGQQYNIAQFNKIEEVLKTLTPDHQYHGEFLICKNSRLLKRKVGNGIFNKILQGGAFEKDEEPVISLWDMVELKHITPKGSYSVPYSIRFKNLSELIKPNRVMHLIETRMVHSFEEALKHNSELVSTGEEGSIIKCPNALWKDGTSKQQAKIKPTKECELRIIGNIPGKGRHKDTFGSLLAVSECGELSVGVSGFTDKQRIEIIENWHKWEDTIISVKFKEVIQNKKKEYSLYEPVFIEQRSDKKEADALNKILKL